jgi:hypothetical protein
MPSDRELRSGPLGNLEVVQQSNAGSSPSRNSAFLPSFSFMPSNCSIATIVDLHMLVVVGKACAEPQSAAQCAGLR